MKHFSRRAVIAGLCALSISAPIGAASAAPAHHKTHRIHPRTLKDLDTSMREEAFAHASYTFYAAQAKREGLNSVARLYTRTASVELNDHFRREAKLSSLVKSNAANLRSAIAGEGFEATTLYPTFARQARRDGDRNAAALFTEIAKDEANHRDRFKAALKVILTGKGKIPAPPEVTPVKVPAGPPKVHSARTKANLNTGMHGEAFANAKYTLFAEHARRTGHPALARLWAGVAGVELHEHFADQAKLAGLVRKTRTNLVKTIVNERYEATVKYPRLARRAEAVGDTKVARVFRENARDQASHARAFMRALVHLR